MKRRLESLVADIADDVSIDWQQVEGASQSDELVRQFRIIAAMGAGRRTEPSSPYSPARVCQVLLAAIAGVGTLKLATMVMALVWSPDPSPRIGVLAVIAAVFGVSGVGLVLGGARDERSKALGAVFIVVGASFVDGYLFRARGASPIGVVAGVLATLPVDAFIPACLWAFAWVFPSPPASRVSTRWGLAGLGGAFFLGCVLFAANALRGQVFDEFLRTSAWAGHLARYPAGTAFWPLVMFASVPALGYLVWKSKERPFQDKSRAAFLILAIVGACAPMILAVLASAVVPALSRPPARAWVGLVVYSGLLSLLPSAVYAVFVQRVVDVHIAVRGAVQHALVRRAVWIATFGSVGYVAAHLYISRERSLSELLSEQVGLMGLTAIGFVALTFRAQLLSAVDRWFERGDADYSAVMTRLAARLSGQRDMRDLHSVLEDELRQALHATSVVVVVVNDDRSAFVSLQGAVPPLPMSSAVTALFQQTAQDLCLGGESADPLVRLLPVADRAWLAAARAEWVFPLFDSAESLLGLLCLGESRGPAYSARDRVLVSAMTDQVALRMENLSLRHWPTEGGRERRSAASVDWQNERAMQCPTCRSVRSSGSTVCACGARLEPATVPLMLNGKFRVERVLGAGGMSVVYLALDIALNRRVAIKTLPIATPHHAARLQREARAMASVLHPNLAMIYGAERWRDVPLLVVEYLDGGTLLDGLRDGAMAVDEVLGLGIELADALDRMHASGLLHRDIKPSNIGYTAEGLPKLLDFGLAAMLDRVHDDLGRPVTLPTEAGALTAFLDDVSPEMTRTLTQQLVGTPLYLSPEALAGQVPDPSFDLWSLAIVLYQAIAGRHPLGGYPAIEAMRRARSVRLPDVRDFRPDCPSHVAAFLNDALSLAIERRPGSAAAFRAQLQAIRRAMTSSPDASGAPLY